MKKHTENRSERPPIDDLFARKLSHLSLPPSADGFERLQARMSQSKPEARIVFWRNPTIQRYVAAACVLLVCLLGWLHQQANRTVRPGDVQIAANKSIRSPRSAKHNPSSALPREAKPQNEPAADLTMPELAGQQAEAQRMAQFERRIKGVRANSRSANQFVATRQQPAVVLSINKDGLAQTKSVKPNASTAETTGPVVSPEQAMTEPVTETVVKPAPERVLIVTIAEPEVLTAARQAVKASEDGKQVVAANDKPDKESKLSGLWQQVRRVKQGEVFARREIGNDERGLIGRAYNGLKHSLDKDKSAKQ